MYVLTLGTCPAIGISFGTAGTANIVGRGGGRTTVDGGIAAGRGTLAGVGADAAAAQVAGEVILGAIGRDGRVDELSVIRVMGQRSVRAADTCNPEKQLKVVR